MNVRDDIEYVSTKRLLKYLKTAISALESENLSEAVFYFEMLHDTIELKTGRNQALEFEYKDLGL